MRTKKSFEAMLPATPCDAEMRAKMQERAAARGVSLAEVQRDAFALFLLRSANKNSTNRNILAQE